MKRKSQAIMWTGMVLAVLMVWAFLTKGTRVERALQAGAAGVVLYMVGGSVALSVGNKTKTDGDA